MHLRHLVLPCLDPDLTLRFYRDVLQQPSHGNTVRIGWSTLECVQAQQSVGSVHLAFNVAPSRFEAAAHWIGARASLMGDSQGRRHFALDGPWQSQSVYFAGPDGAVLELIARDALQDAPAGTGQFHGEELLCLSEIGLPSDNVEVVTRSVAHHFGLRPFAPPVEGFAALGDDHGLLIVVDQRRRWFPQQRQLPWADGLRVSVDTPQPGLRLRDAQGWELLAA
ncbi:hypothetical protein [Xanthomonas cannabis]|uniref:hypothetical protein n=1 Tax=Xanthomonas cannabis TaxID=1885674 RepID=UPI000574D9A4|nr:hypothetical protein [Xanthomonas cannabis]KHL52596.1 hypothetical protein OZ10_17140 [Xanthomonas cannabis pv. cannabis]KHL54737.1 hypothetical protein OZ13_13240 [Xanthomonas cannabis pv. cannabis]MCC8441994.1 hypothetical protein [Xanthomonas cannabis]